jgi:hypothetical protein
MLCLLGESYWACAVDNIVCSSSSSPAAWWSLSPGSPSGWIPMLCLLGESYWACAVDNIVCSSSTSPAAWWSLSPGSPSGWIPMLCLLGESLRACATDYRFCSLSTVRALLHSGHCLMGLLLVRSQYCAYNMCLITWHCQIASYCII